MPLVADPAASTYCTVTFPVVALLRLTTKLHADHSQIDVSLTLIVGALSVSVTVATHVPSVIVAFVGFDNTILNVSLHS